MDLLKNEVAGVELILKGWSSPQHALNLFFWRPDLLFRIRRRACPCSMGPHTRLGCNVLQFQYMDACLNIDMVIYICNAMQYDDQVQKAAAVALFFSWVSLQVAGGADQ